MNYNKLMEEKETKLIGIDYGSKKVGLSISDKTHSFAFPFKLLKNKGHEDLIKEIKNILKDEKISEIIMGESLNYEMKDNPVMKGAREFAEELKKEFKIPIEFEPEILTTAQAARTQEKKDIDASAAAIILQSYIDKEK